MSTTQTGRHAPYCTDHTHPEAQCSTSERVLTSPAAVEDLIVWGETAPDGSQAVVLLNGGSTVLTLAGVHALQTVLDDILAELGPAARAFREMGGAS
jgi:hypothetical protein